MNIIGNDVEHIIYKYRGSDYGNKSYWGFTVNGPQNQMFLHITLYYELNIINYFLITKTIMWQFENIHLKEFKYLFISVLLCVVITIRSIGITNRFMETKKVSYILIEHLKLKMFSRTTKVHLCAAIHRSALTYECDAWTLIGEIEKKSDVVWKRNIKNYIWSNYIAVN